MNNFIYSRNNVLQTALNANKEKIKEQLDVIYENIAQASKEGKFSIMVKVMKNVTAINQELRAQGYKTEEEVRVITTASSSFTQTNLISISWEL